MRHSAKQKPPLTAACVAPPRRLELRSSAPEADTLSTELRGRAKKFYHGLVGARHVSLLQIIYAVANGASLASSVRYCSMSFVFPPSSPIVASCSFLWASSPST